MAKVKNANLGRAYGVDANVTLAEFLAGEPLSYSGFRRRCVATYRLGVGVLIEDTKGKALGVSTVATTDAEAKRAYWNMTRSGAQK
jgi:hypothetical protein